MPVDEHVLRTTVRSLHALAELVLAGPQLRSHDTVRLRVVPGGFGTEQSGVSLVDAELVWADGRTPLTGTYRELADAVGLDVGPPVDLYADLTGTSPDEAVAVDPAAFAVVAGWHARGAEALRLFAPEVAPILWPEHFDLALSVDGCGYGVSPGDDEHPQPYAYVGPHTPRTGPFWDQPFGALRSSAELPDAEAVAAFFAEGRAQL